MDAGGKIRSANILKNLKGGAFTTRLLMPATAREAALYATQITSLADDVTLWRAAPHDFLWRLRRAAGLFSRTPISALSDADARAKEAVAAGLAHNPDIAVFDYAQTLAMTPASLSVPSVLFAHNVETEILDRHATTATGAMRHVWKREAAKMRAFESAAAARVNCVIAVSERDAAAFRDSFDAREACAIPTGVDLDYFAYAPPQASAAPALVFTGSMDWKANQDGLFWFMDEVWPLIAQRRPDASFTVIGKNPPPALVARSRALNWRFTGYVDDVRPHAKGAAFVIPLRIGGGTRLKAFEAMAMGLPVVSTALGAEGLPVVDGEQLLIADDAAAFAAAVLRLLADADLRSRLAANARALVENNFSHRAAARVFERHCLAILDAAR